MAGRVVTCARNWQQFGACQSRDTAKFFHPEGDSRRNRRRREEQAIAVCAGCLVRAECGAYALSVHEPYGIWGGLTERERRRLWTVACQDLADPPRRRVDHAVGKPSG